MSQAARTFISGWTRVDLGIRVAKASGARLGGGNERTRARNERKLDEEVEYTPLDGELIHVWNSSDLWPPTSASLSRFLTWPATIARPARSFFSNLVFLSLSLSLSVFFFVFPSDSTNRVLCDRGSLARASSLCRPIDATEECFLVQNLCRWLFRSDTGKLSWNIFAGTNFLLDDGSRREACRKYWDRSGESEYRFANFSDGKLSVMFFFLIENFRGYRAFKDGWLVKFNFEKCFWLIHNLSKSWRKFEDDRRRLNSGINDLKIDLKDVNSYLTKLSVECQRPTRILKKILHQMVHLKESFINISICFPPNNDKKCQLSPIKRQYARRLKKHDDL